MAKIGRSWDELDKKIKEVNKSIKQTKTEVRALDKELKLDPTNINLITQKYGMLEKELGDNAKKTELLKQKQRDLLAAFNSGEINLTQYQRLLDKTATEEKKLTLRTQELTASLAQKNQVMAKAKYDSIINGANQAAQAVQPLANAMKAFAAAGTLAFKYAVDVGSELDDLSHKYQTNAEALQIEGNLMERATGVSDSYVGALKSIGAVMTAVSKGSTRYNIALQQIELTTQDLKGKTNAEVYDLLLEKLQEIPDAAERATAAQTLLGDAGLNLALRAGMSAEEIAEFNNNLQENGIISSEQAERMAYVGDRLDDIKQRVKTIIVNIIDAFTSLSPFGQGLIITLMAVVMFLPKIITSLAGIKAGISMITSGTIAQTIATQGLNAAMGPILPLLIAISAAVLGLIALIGVLSKKARNAADEGKRTLEELKKSLPEMEGNLEQSTTTTYESSSSKKIEIDANVTAEGDTPISQDNARAMGEGFYSAIASDLDQLLGDTIKE